MLSATLAGRLLDGTGPYFTELEEMTMRANRRSSFVPTTGHVDKSAITSPYKPKDKRNKRNKLKKKMLY